MCVPHRGHCMVLSIPRRWIQIEVQFTDIAFHISYPDRFHRGRGWCRLKLWILMATARVHIFSKCIFRLNDAAHSRAGCSVQTKDIVSKGPILIFSKCHFYWSGLSGMVLESVIYSGQLKNIKNSDQTQWQKWLTSLSQESFLRGQPSASAARAQFSPHS